ncbi:hypothetical protein QAD02_008002 [Eretmocerus hayati]|uniref:Uncharacterized protein n=1 Tax=Eretmocerus hayati TaxID=131215 RepID=A0ACC2N578_9HYME|nr:hypothetical protein QAD02_008002 [Eretmocerus hayati]
MANEQYGYFWGGEQRPIEVDDDVELLRRDFERMSLATAQRFERVDGALLGLDARMNEITRTVDGIIIPKMNELVNFISEQDVRMNGIGARMDVDFPGVNGRIDRMEMDIAEMAPRMNLIEDRVSGFNSRTSTADGHQQQRRQPMSVQLRRRRLDFLAIKDEERAWVNHSSPLLQLEFISTIASALPSVFTRSSRPGYDLLRQG